MNRSQSVFALVIVCVIVASAVLARPADNTSTLGLLLARTTATPQQSAPIAITVTTAPTPTATVAAPVDASPAAEGEAISIEEIQNNSENNGQIPELSGTDANWNPPEMAGPVASHPWDHFWLHRPVAPDNTNYALPDYTFGSNGAADDFRIHHGIDIANPIGVEVYAAADGVVLWSGKGSVEEDATIKAYGQTIVIQHDIGWKGETIYTLYAHLSTRLVENEDRITANQVIGLIGDTGDVTGPHVHFEVRIGRNRYNSVYNPLLWILPYDGTGIVAGRVLIEDGTPAYDASIIAINRRTGEVVFQTSTYAGGGIHSDPNWNENFAIPDLPAGDYRITAEWEGQQWSGEVTVVPGITNWVEMTPISSGASPINSAADGS